RSHRSSAALLPPAAFLTYCEAALDAGDRAVTSGARGEVTDLLLAWRQDGHVPEELMELLYADLKRRAAAYLRAERPGHTLQPTPPVHEAYLPLVAQHSGA